ncbi:hypothetical protein MferCBS31731_007342 [Microsporum ferrugineum]
MGDATILSLSNSEAAEWNRALMLEFQAALEADPAVDLMSIFPDSYRRQHQYAEEKQLSYPAAINRQTLNDLDDELRRNPEVNLLSVFPSNYNRRITMATGPKVEKTDTPKVQAAPEYLDRLDLAKTATVVFPLSEKVTPLLAKYSDELSDDKRGDEEHHLAESLKRLLLGSEKIWEGPARGVVVKCSDDIVAKLIMGNDEYTEYTILQYLERWMPDIPAPRPHGLIAFAPFRVVFMSYVPGMTLTKAWPNLTHEDKLSIQRQLDAIFRRLRTIRQDDGHPLGGISGEGVKDMNVNECSTFKDITTAAAFSDLQFSVRHYGSNSYIKLLRSLLRHDNSSMYGSVFSHGDLRTDNIMVKRDPDNKDHYVVSGIIDWEEGGFYPEYYECTALSRCLSVIDENDWYNYLPECISPSRFPVRWLVDRLWGIHLKTT